MGVDGSSKSPLFDGRGQSMNDNEQVRGNEVTFEEPHEIHANEDDIVKGCSEDRRYFTRERRSLGEWWKNHNLLQHGEECSNVTIIEGPLSWSEAYYRETYGQC